MWYTVIMFYIGTDIAVAIKVLHLFEMPIQ